jgi:hypothetical protein
MLNSDHDDSDCAMLAASAMEAYPQEGAKQKSPSSIKSSPRENFRKQPNGRARKERQPTWSGPEVLALIAAKEEEYEAQKVTGD